MKYEFAHVMLKVCVKFVALLGERPDRWENLRTWWDNEDLSTYIWKQKFPYITQKESTIFADFKDIISF